MSSTDAIRVAREYIAAHMPDFAYVNSQHYDADAIDRGLSWGVVFSPPGVLKTGGTPEFTVDKRTLKILDVQMSR